MEKIIFGPVTL